MMLSEFLPHDLAGLLYVKIHHKNQATLKDFWGGSIRLITSVLTFLEYLLVLITSLGVSTYDRTF